MTLHLPNYSYRAELVRVVDADTLDVDLDLGFYVWARKRLRLAGINAWETRGTERDKGLAAKAFVQSLLTTADRLYCQTYLDATGKYGRVLAVVWVVANDNPPIDLNRFLVKQGHAIEVEY